MPGEMSDLKPLWRVRDADGNVMAEGQARSVPSALEGWSLGRVMDVVFDPDRPTLLEGWSLEWVKEGDVSGEECARDPNWNRWAAFTDDEMQAIAFPTTAPPGWVELEAEAQAEIERRRTDG